MATVRTINPSAPLDRTVRAEVDPSRLLDLGGLDPSRWRLDGPADHAHGVDVVHVSLRSDRTLDLGRLKLFLQFVAARRTWSLLRLKGIFRCEGHARAVVAHGVYQWLELGPGAFDPPLTSAVLLIGRGLDAAEIERAWVAAGA